MNDVLEILDDITKTKKSYQQHKFLPEIDIEIIDAYIEMKFIYKLYEYVENLPKI